MYHPFSREHIRMTFFGSNFISSRSIVFSSAVEKSIEYVSELVNWCILYEIYLQFWDSLQNFTVICKFTVGNISFCLLESNHTVSVSMVTLNSVTWIVLWARGWKMLFVSKVWSMLILWMVEEHIWGAWHFITRWRLICNPCCFLYMLHLLW